MSLLVAIQPPFQPPASCKSGSLPPRIPSLAASHWLWLRRIVPESHSDGGSLMGPQPFSHPLHWPEVASHAGGPPDLTASLDSSLGALTVDFLLVPTSAFHPRAGRHFWIHCWSPLSFQGFLTPLDRVPQLDQHFCNPRSISLT